MKNLKIYCLIAILIGITSFIHPFFVGVTEINWNSKNGKIGLSIKLFTDDLQEAVYKSEKVKFQSLVKSESNKLAINQFILKHFSIKIVDKKMKYNALPLKMIGWEVEDEATWVYFEFEGNKMSKKAKSIMVQNEILFENIPNQIHIVHCTKNGQRKSEQFSMNKPAAVFNWDK